MAELRDVKIEKIDPNPFRDGSGGTPPATWKTLAEVYGFDEKKLEELAQSYKTNGIWAGVHVRPIPGGRYQLAFGHHRFEAANMVGAKTFPVIVEELSDSQMLNFMASENSEEYGHDFALGVMNAVEAVVKAYGSGLIKLESPGAQTRKDELRFAPSFLRNDDGQPRGDKPYVAGTVGKYLGWTEKDRSTGSYRATERVRTALSALELIEAGALKRGDLKGLGSGQAAELVMVVKRKRDAELERIEREKEALERMRASAAKADEKHRVKQLEKKIEQVAAEGAQHSKAAARAAATSVVGFYKEGLSFTKAAEKASEALGLEKAVKPVVAPKKLDLSGVDEFISKLDRTLLEEDVRWGKILQLAQVKAAAKTFGRLDEALLRLAARAEARAKELRKVIS